MWPGPEAVDSKPFPQTLFKVLNQPNQRELAFQSVYWSRCIAFYYCDITQIG